MTLYLSNVNFTGAFPTTWSNLTGLNYLDLSDNSFTAGAIPDLSAIRYLFTLNLSNTNRTGAFPTHLSKMYYLIHFDLSHNQLSSSIPSALGRQPEPTGVCRFLLQSTRRLYPVRIRGLVLPANAQPQPQQLYRDLPELGQPDSVVSRPQQQQLHHRGFPSWITSETTLRTLRLSNVNFTGTFPTLSSLTSLSHLNLSHNKFTGAIPSAFGNSASLVELDLSHNQLNGTVPPLGSLPKLEVLNLGDNQLSGTIPAVSSLTTLKTLNLGGNQLSGSIPAVKRPDQAGNAGLRQQQPERQRPDLERADRPGVS